MGEDESFSERLRIELVQKINSNPHHREWFELLCGKDNVWDTKQLQEAFTVKGFLAPICAVVRKSDGVFGSVLFQHDPRYYFDFREEAALQPDREPEPTGEQHGR